MNSIKLTFVGDIFPANLSYNRNCGVASINFDDDNRYKYVHQIKKIVSPESLFIGNLESPILPLGVFSKEMQFAGHPNFIKLLKESGISLVSLANNHILEHSSNGLFSTVRILEENNIKYVGTYDKDGKTKIEIIEENGIRIAFIAYNAIDNQKHEEGLVSVYDFKTVKNDIYQLRRNSLIDYIFILIHWGDEYIHRPSAAQIEQAHALVDAGANFIICSHPHVVQPVEEYHKGLICYSLGNFVFDMTIPKSSMIGMVVDINLNKTFFSHKERIIKLQDNFFPIIQDNDDVTQKKLRKQKLMMNRYQSVSYKDTYEREKRLKRLIKRIVEKQLLIKNWRKYTPKIRKEIISTYRKKIFGI